MNVISIVIRCKNEVNNLKLTALSLEKQFFDGVVEVVFVDNESTDGSLEFAQQKKWKIVTIAKDDFTYGRALNLGISNCTSEVVLILSAHTFLIGTSFLNDAYTFFNQDKNIAAIRCTSVANFNQLSQSYQKKEIRFANSELRKKHELLNGYSDYVLASCCLINKAVWNNTKFDAELQGSEEKKWSQDILDKAEKIVTNVPLYYHYFKTTNQYKQVQTIVRDYGAVANFDPYFANKEYKKLVKVAFKAIVYFPVKALKLFAFHNYKFAKLIVGYRKIKAITKK